MKLHKSFQKILDDSNKEDYTEVNNDKIEAIIRTHLEKALEKAGMEIEKTFNITNVIVTADVKQVSVYVKKQT